MVQKTANTIPVYDICSLSSLNHAGGELIAEPFAAYLAIHPNLHLAHRHSFYHIVFFTSGAGYHTIDFERFEVLAGQVYFMIPGQVHSWNFSGAVDGFVINFSENLFRFFLANDQYLQQYPFFRGIAHDSVCQISGQAYNDTVAIFENIISDTRNNDISTADYIRACLMQLFITVLRAAPITSTNQAPQQNQLLLHNFRKLVDSYYAEKRLPKDYAAMLYITPNHLNALCNDLLGKPAGAIIRDRILLEAKRLLISAELSISTIALQLSFADNSHFTKFFKKCTSLTPEQFRQAAVGNINNQMI